MCVYRHITGRQCGSSALIVACTHTHSYIYLYACRSGSSCRQSSSYVKYYLRFVHCPVAVISLFILCAVAAVACNTHTHTPLCTFARPLLLCILHFTFFFVLTFGFIRICVRSLVCWFFLAVCCFYCYCQLLADCCHFNCYLTLIVKHTLESLLLLLLLFVVFSRTTAIVRPRSTVCLPFIYSPALCHAFTPSRGRPSSLHLKANKDVHTHTHTGTQKTHTHTFPYNIILLCAVFVCVVASLDCFMALNPALTALISVALLQCLCLSFALFIAGVTFSPFRLAKQTSRFPRWNSLFCFYWCAYAI